jgi:hypothetical protein
VISKDSQGSIVQQTIEPCCVLATSPARDDFWDKVILNGWLSRSENSGRIVLAYSDNRNVDSMADVLEGRNLYDVTRSNLLEQPAAAKRARVRASGFVADCDSQCCAFLDSVSFGVLR